MSPIMVLCKSHTVENLDKSNSSVLNELEQSMKLRNTLESVNPALKLFFRGKAAVVEAVIYALLKLVTYDKSTNSCSLADVVKLHCGKGKKGGTYVLVPPTQIYKLRLWCSINTSCSTIASNASP